MDEHAVITVLNELLALEQRGLARRLIESTPFVSHLAIRDFKVVEDVVKASQEHGTWLSQVIHALDGVPGLRLADTSSADLHYQQLRNMLPRLVADHQALIRKYKLAARRVADEQKAADVVARILERHRNELDTLNQLDGSGSAAAS